MSSMARGRIGGDHVMARGDQLPGQQSRAAAELEHQALPGAYRGEEIHDPRGARGRVEPEAPVVHGGEVRPVARAVRGVHPAILAPLETGSGADAHQPLFGDRDVTRCGLRKGVTFAVFSSAGSLLTALTYIARYCWTAVVSACWLALTSCCS